MNTVDQIKHYSNSSGPLTPETDYFNTYYKADSLIKLLYNHRDFFNDHNFIALYGSWGSGKSRILHTIESNILISEIYKTVFFEAWKYEFGNDLIFSLFDCIFEKLTELVKDSDDCKLKLTHLKENAIKNFSPQYKVNTSLNLGLLNLGAELSNSEIHKSSYQRIKAFGILFNNTIQEIIKLQHGKDGSQCSKLLVFIDDLDRCEPENVLNILSAIKHFFASDQIIYICAIDKDAISKALFRKYKETIGVNDYLNKIFDYTYIMPTSPAMEKMTTAFLKDFLTKDILDDDMTLFVNTITQMLSSIGLTNPRKTNYLFRKCLILKEISKSMSKELTGSTFDQIFSDSLISTVFIIYFVYLYEEDNEAFMDLLFVKRKHPPKWKINPIITISAGNGEAATQYISDLNLLYPLNQVIFNNLSFKNDDTFYIHNECFYYWLALPFLDSAIITDSTDRDIYIHFRTKTRLLFEEIKNHILFNLNFSLIHGNFIEFLLKNDSLLFSQDSVEMLSILKLINALN